MHRQVRLSVALAAIIFVYPQSSVVATQQASEPDSAATVTNQVPDYLTPEDRFVDTTLTVRKLDFDGVLIREALTALARTYKISCYIDTSVSGSLRMRLENVSLDDAFRLIVFENGLTAERVGKTLKILRLPQPTPEPPKVTLTSNNGLISIEAKGVPVSSFASDFSDFTRINVTLQRGVTGTITGKVVDLSPKRALVTLLETNNYLANESDGVFIVDLPTAEQVNRRQRASRRFNVSLENETYQVQLSGAELETALNALIALTDANLVRQKEITGTVSASFEASTLDQALSALLRGSEYTFKRVDELYIIGSSSATALHESRLIKLRNLRAETVEKLLPASIMSGLTHNLYLEQNAILVTGPVTRLDDVQEFVRRADVPPAQVLFDVLVVDYSRTSSSNMGLDITRDRQGDVAHTYFPKIDVDERSNLKDVGDHLGIANLGKLSDQFYVRLQALASEGKANIIQRPQIASLNGHAASIAIGTTQYFLLRTQTDYPSAQTDVTTRSTERFETIEASISLQVTPHVTSYDEVIVDIKPEFNTPAGEGFDPDIPPTINKRVLESTVKLRNGETIVLGGLVNSVETVNIDKLPILGDIPLLGRLFQNRSKIKNESELMIYITPHVYYGGDGSIEIEGIVR